MSAAMYLLIPALVPERFLAPRYPLAKSHRRNALGAVFLLALLVLLFAISVIFISYVMIHFREVYQAWKLEPRTLDALWKTLLAWLVVYFFALIHALWRPQTPAPVLSALGSRAWVRGVAASFLVLALVLLGVTAGVTAHAQLLTRSDAASGKVFFVYEDNKRFPAFLFRLGAYPLALAAKARYGDVETQVLPISPENLRRAFREGEFVVVGSHGTSEGLITHEGYFTPADLSHDEVSRRLRYVYLTGCDSGDLARAWRRKLRPAHVVTHDRLTAVPEHVWWLWMEGPRILSELPPYQPDSVPRRRTPAVPR
ncbi:MAG: hypothetical protein GC168_04450 [Candidatus Hydrogenedens sp.]|nr:hypothetical protein [Candidatus Hydrogenedens sp.]